jgi:glucose-1-phosphatase
MELLNGIKNIIFDLGGVVINLDYNITLAEFKKLGIDDFDGVFNKNHQLDNLEKGKISGKQFVTEVKKYLPDSISDNQVIKAWNAMLLDFPEERAELLKKLKGKYRTFLLSNTNELHLDSHFGLLQKENGVNYLSTFFEKQYFSNIIGMRKPDADIYEFVLNENGLKPDETLFIDDKLENIEGAIRCGIRSFHLEKPLTLMDVFN